MANDSRDSSLMKWLKLIVGIELLPFVWAVSLTFFQTVASLGHPGHFFKSDHFIFFLAGFVAWTVIFLTLPKPMRLYVLGHELTHAIWVIAMGGRVTGFKVGKDGGHVQTDTVNFWIAPGPYFFPIYTVFIILLYGLCNLFWDLAPWVGWLYFLIGLSWSFHVVFTLKMIPTVQPDITSNGWLFSLVVIYIMNVLIVWCFLLTVVPELPWGSNLLLLWENTVDAYVGVIATAWRIFMDMIGMISDSLKKNYRFFCDDACGLCAEFCLKQIICY
ncbi:hypothetical protein QQ056_16340 [Oscillatoria laete-virens NRMC-F 0139]|nr:hypothetical protein [Oscillatoria laete-virens]MDL5055107.1 hypothetical protein [Oscillatoria laete-virens NRMC-F 0139]